jgi:uncharacterized tellurite resistance protein B-like protein
MEESDIQEVKKLLKQAYKLEDWSMIEEVIDYLDDFCDTSIYSEDDEN